MSLEQYKSKEESVPNTITAENLAGEVRAVRGNREGGKTWQKAIWTVLDKHEIKDPEERARLMVELSEILGFASTPKPAVSEEVQRMRDERHNQALRSRGD